MANVPHFTHILFIQLVGREDFSDARDICLVSLCIDFFLSDYRIQMQYDLRCEPRTVSHIEHLSISFLTLYLSVSSLLSFSAVSNGKWKIYRVVRVLVVERENVLWQGRRRCRKIVFRFPNLSISTLMADDMPTYDVLPKK